MTGHRCAALNAATRTVQGGRWVTGDAMTEA